MNSLVLYYSKFGNTKRIAKTIAATLEQAGTARASSIERCGVDELRHADLVVVGSPTHYQAVPKAVRSCLKGYPRQSLRGKWVAAFDTSLQMWGPIMALTAAHGMMARLRRLGGRRAVRPETFGVGEHNSSSEDEIDLLGDGEIERAQAWAQAILRRTHTREQQ
jgi:flavodoxin